jgi:hypothetical protein
MLDSVLYTEITRSIELLALWLKKIKYVGNGVHVQE